jgi:GT2 family glycosyltransferase
LDLSIIIVNWKSVGFLRKCLKSIYENTRQVSFETVVIDNASYDGSREMVGTDFPTVKFVQSDINLGFADAKL